MFSEKFRHNASERIADSAGLKEWVAQIPVRNERGDGTVSAHLVRQQETNECSIKIDDNQGREILLLSDLFKPSLRFVIGNDFNYEYESRTVTIPNSLHAARDLLVVLHEACHIVVFDKKPDLRTAVRNFRKGKRFSYPSENPVLSMERDVWAHVIDLMRKLRADHGIDLFQLFTSRTAFAGWMRATSLRTYESMRDAQGNQQFTRGVDVKAFFDQMGDFLTHDEARIIDEQHKNGALRNQTK